MYQAGKQLIMQVTQWSMEKIDDLVAHQNLGRRLRKGKEEMILTYKAGVFQLPKFFQKGKDVIHPYNLEDWYTPYGFIFPDTSEALALKLFFMDGVKAIDIVSKISCHHVLDADGNFFRYFLATANDARSFHACSLPILAEVLHTMAR
jgi:hypothetical protein